jgi:hypothetical protein
VSGLTLGPFRVLTSEGGLEDLAAGRAATFDLAAVEARLPKANSLRRSGDEAKMAVVAAAEVLAEAGLAPDGRTALYVGQQQGGFDFCAQFIEASVRSGPRLASPMHFSESVANNTATHLSLTLGLRGSVQTFIGTRVAAIQALQAAREDLETGVADTGLVVVVGTSTAITRDAYAAVLRPRDRRRREAPPSYLRGAAAFLIRPSGGSLRLESAELRCAGRGTEARSLRALWERRGGGRLLVSGHRLKRDAVERAVREATGLEAPAAPSFGECFALDPVLQLLLDAKSAPRGRRTLACLSEEGTVGLLGVST